MSFQKPGRGDTTLDALTSLLEDNQAWSLFSWHGWTFADAAHPHDATAPDPTPGFGAAAGSASSKPLAITFDTGLDLNAIATGGIGVSFGNTFKLHSLPTSSIKIFLDFDGHTTTGTAWNSYWNTASFDSSAFSQGGTSSFSAAELTAIQQIWQRVAEYYAPFNIDVTTEDPGAAALSYSGSGDTAYGKHVVITNDTTVGQTAINYGGIAYVSSFTSNVDTPAFVFASNLALNAKYIADAAAHEVGHSLGLNHDGQGTAAYYYGHGAGATSWAPVMGVGYYANIVQWSNGGYTGATNTEDDLSIITSRNVGVTYRADDVGNTFGTAAALGGTVAGGIATVAKYGLITGSGARNDIDMYALNVSAGGSINLHVGAETRYFITGSATPTEVDSPFTMLDVAVTVYDASYQTVAVFNDPARIDAQVTLTGLTSGVYYLALDGVGWGTPTANPPTGYSEYGSLGQYQIKGSYSYGGAAGPTGTLVASKAALTTTEAGGTDSLVLQLVGGTIPVTVNITGADPTEETLAATSVVLSAANNWTATLTATGLQDRDVDGSVTSTLTIGAQGLAPISVTVTNGGDDDRAAVSAGAAAGGRPATASNATLAAISADDGNAMTISEGGNRGSYAAEWRWQFSGLSGDQIVQADVTSAREAFRLEYSVDNAASWKAFAGAPTSATAWTGNYAATGAGSALWVRLLDASQTSDNQRDNFVVDLLTVTAAAPAATQHLAATAASDHHLV